MSRAVAYSSTTVCSVKLPGRCPRSIKLRRRSPSTASSTCPRGFGASSTASNSSRLTGSRTIASHSSTLCSRAERRANCSPSNSRTLPKTASPCSRNAAITPPKSSAMVCAAMFKASGLPAYTSTSRARSCALPCSSRSSNNCPLATISSPARRKARTGFRLPSSGRRSIGFSRLVSSRQLWCAVSPTRRSSCAYPS